MDRPDPLNALAARWRSEAETLRRYGAAGQADALDACADELDAALAARATESLTLAEAANESGFSTVHLGRLVREGAIPNVGRHGAPRVRRGDLPKKAGRGPRLRAVEGGRDLADELLARREGR